jgi:hypothetical protein
VPLDTGEWQALLCELMELSPREAPAVNLQRRELLQRATAQRDKQLRALESEGNVMCAVIAALKGTKLPRALRKLPELGARTTVADLRARAGSRVERDLGRGMSVVSAFSTAINAPTCTVSVWYML